MLLLFHISICWWRGHMMNMSPSLNGNQSDQTYPYHTMLKGDSLIIFSRLIGLTEIWGSQAVLWASFPLAHTMLVPRQICNKQMCVLFPKPWLYSLWTSIVPFRKSLAVNGSIWAVCAAYRAQAPASLSAQLTPSVHWEGRPNSSILKRGITRTKATLQTHKALLTWPIKEKAVDPPCPL